MNSDQKLKRPLLIHPPTHKLTQKILPEEYPPSSPTTNAKSPAVPKRQRIQEKPHIQQKHAYTKKKTQCEKGPMPSNEIPISTPLVTHEATRDQIYKGRRHRGGIMRLYRTW